MVEDIFMCFNNRQLNFVFFLLKVKMILPVEAGGVRHPLTDKTEIVFQKYKANRHVNKILQWLFSILMGAEGKERLQRMLDCGAIKKCSQYKGFDSDNIEFKA